MIQEPLPVWPSMPIGASTELPFCFWLGAEGEAPASYAYQHYHFRYDLTYRAAEPLREVIAS